MRENRLGELAPLAPVLIHHARHDQIVPFAHAQQLHREWQQRGVDTRMYVTPGARDHLTAGLVGTRVGLRWLASRLEERRPPRTEIPAKRPALVRAAA
jgi:acetyl esterase/lipase